MFLDQKMFQRLAEKIIEDIGYNINIIDTDGIIIASGDKERIGKYHAIGHKAALEEKQIHIHQEEEGLYSGVKFGINQPFYYKGELLGIVGITGEVKKTAEFVKVVKTMIELMVEQEMLKESIYHRQSNKSYFANLIFNLKNEEDEVLLLEWARSLGYSFSIARVIVLISFDEKYDSQISTDIINQIKGSSLHRKEDFSAVLSMGKILILKSLPNAFDKKYVKEYINDIYNKVNQVSKEALVAVSSAYQDVKLYKYGFEEASFILKQLNKEHKQIGCIEEYISEYLLEKIPQSCLLRFVGNYIEKLEASKELLETVEGLTICGMNLLETAKHLFIHRNTVVFRLTKIKELTGLDPLHNAVDRTYFQLISVYYRLYIKQGEE